MKKTILVTGAAVRIGREIALTFAKDGWNIIIHCNSSTERAEALAKEIGKTLIHLQRLFKLILIKTIMLKE